MVFAKALLDFSSSIAENLEQPAWIIAHPATQVLFVVMTDILA